MANFLESAKIILQDRVPLYKTGLYSILLFLTYCFFSVNNMFLYFVFLFFTTIIYFGLFTSVLHNSIHEEMRLVPGPKILFTLFGRGFKAFIALLPFLLIGGFLITFLIDFVSGMVKFEELQKNILFIVVYSVFGLFLFTPLLFFSKEYKMGDTYDFKSIGKHFYEVLVNSLAFVLLGVVLNLLTTGFLAYFVWMLFGFKNMFAYYICFVITLNLSVYANFLGQLHYEFTTFDVD